MALKLPDSAVPMGDFPVAKAVDIDFDDGENLQEKLDNGKLGGEGNTTDITDLENRVTTNEADITDLQEQMDNLDIPDLTDINTKLTQLESKATLIPVIGDNPTDKDLNNYKENGNYSIGASNDYSNVPVKSSGLLTVITGNSYKLQIYTVVNGNNVYFRKSTNWGNSWSSWSLLNKSSDADITDINTKLTQLESKATTNEADITDINTKLTQLETKANFIPITSDNPTTSYDLNDYKENGNYGIGASAEYSNVPIKRSGLLTVIRSSSYRLQIYTVVDNNDVYFRKSTNWGNSWTSWVLLNGKVDLTGTNTKISQLETQVSDLFQSVSDGKTLVANAITDKGVSTSTTATFATMATNISKINTNGYKEETVSYDKTSTGANRIIVTFSDDVYGVKQITPPSDASSNIVPETLTSMFTINGKKLILYVNGVGTWKVTAMVRNA